MTTEELKIKVSLDTSGLKQDVAKVKTTMKGAEESMSGKGMNKGAQATTESINQLRDSLEKIRNLQFADLIIENFDKIKRKANEVKTYSGSGIGNAINEMLQGLDFLNPFSKVNDEIWGLNTKMKEFSRNTKARMKEAFDASSIGRAKAKVDKFVSDTKNKFKGFSETVKKLLSKMWEKFGNTKPGASIQSALISFKEGGSSLVGVFKKFGDLLKNFFKNVLAWLGVLLGMIIATVATIRMAVQNAKQIAQVSREAQKIGLSTRDYQEWGYILEQNGVQIDKLSDFLKTLADEQNAVREGSKDIIQAFEKIGISAEEAANMNQSDLFAKTVEGLQGVENSVERTGIAYKIFGEDAAQLMPILSMSSQEIAQLRQNYELLGGAASATLVQRSQQLQSSLGNLNQAWAGVKNAITEAVLPAIIAVVNWFTKAVAIIGMFFRAILGTSKKKAETSTSNMTSGMGGYTSAVEGATAAVQKLKREQMGFDELNVLPGKDESSGGSSNIPSSFSSGGGGLGDIDIPTVEDMGLGKWQEWFDKYKTTIQDITTWSLIAIGAIMAVIAILHGNIPMAIVGIGIAGLGVAIGSVDGGTFDRIGKAIFEWWDSKLLPWWENSVKPIFTKAFWVEKFDQIKTAASDKLTEIKTKIDEKVKPIKDWFNKNIKPVFTKKYWQDKFDTIKAGANEKLQSAKEAITGKWDSVKKWFDKNVKSKFTKKYWTDKFDTVRSAASSKLQGAKDAITGVWSSTKKWFDKNVKPKFTTSYWKGKFDTVKNGARQAFNGVISIVESAVNNIIRKINTLSWKIPDWVPKVGGQKFGFNFKTVSIPRLATGGIATRSVLANIGENGREAVLPLDNNTSWMDALADKIAARNSAPSRLYLQVDGKTLGWVAIDNINKITKQTGEIQLAL